MNRFAIVFLCCAACGAGQTTGADHEHGSGGGKVLMLAPDLEMRLAVNVLPKPLQAGATILVLGKWDMWKRGKAQIHLLAS